MPNLFIRLKNTTREIRMYDSAVYATVGGRAYRLKIKTPDGEKYLNISAEKKNNSVAAIKTETGILYLNSGALTRVLLDTYTPVRGDQLDIFIEAEYARNGLEIIATGTSGGGGSDGGSYGGASAGSGGDGGKAGTCTLNIDPSEGGVAVTVSAADTTAVTDGSPGGSTGNEYQSVYQGTSDTRANGGAGGTRGVTVRVSCGDISAHAYGGGGGGGGGAASRWTSNPTTTEESSGVGGKGGASAYNEGFANSGIHGGAGRDGPNNPVNSGQATVKIWYYKDA